MLRAAELLVIDYEFKGRPTRQTSSSVALGILFAVVVFTPYITKNPAGLHVTHILFTMMAVNIYLVFELSSSGRAVDAFLIAIPRPY